MAKRIKEMTLEERAARRKRITDAITSGSKTPKEIAHLRTSLSDLNKLHYRNTHGGSLKGYKSPSVTVIRGGAKIKVNQDTGEETVLAPASYEDWLKYGGSPYAQSFSDETINAEYDPYYNKLLGGEEYNKTQAQEQLGRNIGNLNLARTQATQDYQKNIGETTRITGQNQNDLGLYGSGIYQRELGRQLQDLSTDYERAYGQNPDSAYNRQLSDLNRGFESQYGSGQYTPYSLRLAQIQEDQRIAKESARNIRQGQAFDAYQRQYQPGGIYYQE